MGFEAFTVVAYPTSSENTEEILNFFDHQLGCVQVCGGMPNDSSELAHFEYSKDNEFIIEIRVGRRQETHHVQFEFALCNPPIVDLHFVKILRHFLAKFPSELWLRTSASREKLHYSVNESCVFLARATKEIAPMREGWKAMFGQKEGAVSVSAAYEFVGFVSANEPRK